MPEKRRKRLEFSEKYGKMEERHDERWNLHGPACPRMSNFALSPTAAILTKVTELRAAGADIISLNVGEPDFPTPAHIKAAAMDALAEDFTRCTPERGILPLREAIARKLERENGLCYSADEITVTVGAKQAIFAAVMVLCGPGDEVLLPIPCWVNYTEMIKLSGATPVFVPVRGDTFELNMEAIAAAITPRTKAIILCTPNNPTGAVYSEEALRQLAALAVEHDFYIIADEIYEKLIYDEAKHFSIASVSDEVRSRTVTVNRFSKAYAMTGWRVGYAAAPAHIIRGIMAMQSQTTSCTNSMAQKAALAELEGSQEDVEAMRRAFADRRDYVVQRLNDMEGVTCPPVRGAFYVYPDVGAYLGKSCGGKRMETSVDLCEYLLTEGLIAAVPGEAFALGGHLRISYSNSMENLKTAMDRMEAALKKLS